MKSGSRIPSRRNNAGDLRTSLRVPSEVSTGLIVAYAAGALLFIAFGIALYRVGVERGSRAAASAFATERDKDPSLDQTLNDAKRESAAAQVELQPRNRSIVELRRDLRKQAAQLSMVKVEREQLEASIRDSEAERQRLVSRQSDISIRMKSLGPS